jgi:hypothetical protein
METDQVIGRWPTVLPACQVAVPTGDECNGATKNSAAAVLQRPGLQFDSLPQDSKNRVDNKKKRHVVVARGNPVSQPRQDTSGVFQFLLLRQPRSSQDSTRFADGGESDPLAALVVGVLVHTLYRFNTARTWT